MSTSTTFEQEQSTGGALVVWLPVVLFPLLALLLFADQPAWIFMWSMAVAVYAGFKGLSFLEYIRQRPAPWGRSLAYLLLWPGMEANAFLDPAEKPVRPTVWEGWFALAKLAAGLSLLGLAETMFDRWPGWITAWTGMAGIVFTLHFGLFHILSVAWRAAGVAAPPIMQAPIQANSLSQFWGRRWNLAFRDAAHNYVFRPLVGRIGTTGAMLAVFLTSGLVHDLVMSPAAGGGYGLPTLYFLLQAGGVMLEKSRTGQRLCLRSGWRGRLFAGTVVLAPVAMLFHRPFIERVVLPMLAAMHAAG